MSNTETIIINDVTSNSTLILNAAEPSTLIINNPGPQGPPGVTNVSMPFAFQGTTMPNENPMEFLNDYPTTLSTNNVPAFASTNATSNTVFTILHNGTNVGNVIFLAGSSTGNVSLTINSIARGDVFGIQPPSSPDSTLSNILITISGNR